MTDNLLLDHISPTRTSSSSVVGESLEEICLNNGINPRKIKQKGLEVRVVKSSQNSIALFAKLRTPLKLRLFCLRNCDHRNFTNCESCENCESQFVIFVRIANILFEYII